MFVHVPRRINCSNFGDVLVSAQASALETISNHMRLSDSEVKGSVCEEHDNS